MREEFSPSQLKSAAQDLTNSGCLRSWVLRYMHGKKPEERQHQKESKVFGTLVHACMQAHMNGKHVTEFSRYLEARQVEEINALPANVVSVLKERAPERAISALHLVPQPKHCDWVRCEEPFSLDTTPWVGDPIKWSKWSAIDLVYSVNGKVFLTDYKTTKGRFYGKKSEQGPWVYVPRESDLESDVQFILYALSVMQKNDVKDLWARWVYIQSHKDCKPQSKAVDVHVTWEEMSEAVQPWLELACDLRSMIREARKTKKKPELEDIQLPPRVHPDPESPCAAYGGCGYHVSRGGQCTAGATQPFTVENLLGVKEEQPGNKEAKMPNLTERLLALSPDAKGMLPPEWKEHVASDNDDPSLQEAIETLNRVAKKAGFVVTIRLD